ncbi:hypothetical protein ACQKFA_23380 [Streptomyces sp. CH6]|uniref:hypothetical protein n=1 Tax=Streptomyces sp. CH6 TaxID=3420320 RepID=UPI003D08E2C6
MNSTLTAWAVAHPWPATALTAVGLALLALAAWGTARALRQLKPPPSSVLVAALAAAVCTAYSADTSWRFAEDHLGMTDTTERAVMFAAGEIALLACAVMARANKAATAENGTAGTAGVPGVLVWCITGIQIVPALAERGLLGGLIRAAFGPVAAGLLWHLAMGLEIRVGRPGALSTGLPAVIGRELRERLLSRLGLATRDRSAEQITRDRATATAVRLASRAHLGPWGRHRLAAAVARSCAAVHAEQRHRLMQELAARRNALGLRTVAVPAPWDAVADEAPQPTRRPEIIAARELREMHPVDAIRATASAHPDADVPALRALLGDLGIVVSETQVGIALKALAPAHTRALGPASAAGHKRRGVHVRIDTDTPPDAPDADQPDADADRALLPDARRVDHDHRTEHGRPASLRALQAALRIGQTRAQRMRALLDAEGPHS